MRSIVILPAGESHMQAFLISAAIVALAEMGDKTQLLSLLLAARFRRPVPIICAIFVATIVNHAFAGAVGAWIMNTLGADFMRWVLGLSFLAMAVWMLIPDQLDEDVEETKLSQLGVFGTTLITFFLAEMGDKTQVATVALAARFASLPAVIAGTTVGMMLANVPAVLLGDRATAKLPIKLIHAIAAIIFALMGLLTLFSGGNLI